MAKHRPQRQNNLSTPQKPKLSVSDLSETDLDETTGPGLQPRRIAQSREEGTTDQTHEDDYTAPISFPRREDLQIKLVDANLVYKLEEYRSDLSYFWAAFWTIVGAILGIIINWVTNNPLIITPSSLIIFIILVLVGILMALFIWRFSKRAKEVKGVIQKEIDKQ